jgi:nucleotide-binding universal stress UspA family protein
MDRRRYDAGEGHGMSAWKPERVLLCTDFSEPANAAVPYGVALVREYGAELYILHVGISFDHLLSAGSDASTREGMREACSLEALSRLGQIELPPKIPHRVHRRFIWSPSAASGIINFAERKAISIVVISSRGRRLVPGILLGSVARNVAAAAPCPVLCVRPPHKGAIPGQDLSHFKIRHVVVPTDGSERSLEAMAYASALAGRSAAKITVLHVLAVDLWLAGLPFGRSEILKGSAAELKADFQKRIAPFTRSAEQQGIEITVAFAEGRPSEEIGHYAKAHDVDMVVMSRKGRRETEHRLGGVPERLLRYAPCPILLV